MLEIARAHHPGVSFVEGNAEALDLPAATFDAAVASFCLLHLAAPEHAAAELARIVVPGGRVGVTVWNTPDRARLMGVVPEAARAAGAIEPADLPAGPAFFRFADDAEMIRLLTGAGLRDAEVITIDWKTPIPSVDHLWRGFADGTARTRALIAAQTADVQARMRDELARALAPYRDGDGYAVPVSVKLGVGTR